MRYTVFDLETDGLIGIATKIHCLSYVTIENGKRIKKGSITDYKLMKTFFEKENTLVGHNIIRFDIPLSEEILGINIKCRAIDTLGLSWYLEPKKGFKHGLEPWGERLGFKKPKILDWNNLDIKIYIERCEADVEINIRLFLSQLSKLNILYEEDETKINQLINYLGFKLDCAREQEKVKIKIDKILVEKSLKDLSKEKEEKVNILQASMPRNIKYKEKLRPAKMLKKDGAPSVAATKWYNLLQNLSLPLETTDLMVEYVNEIGNPGSSAQVKTWLFALGWIPITFEWRKNKAGDIKKVPQIYDNDGVCQSIKRLYNIEPALESLDMLSLINHRIGVFNSYLDNMDSNNYVKAEIAGFTNTLRFRHKKPITNLPKISKFYGNEIRGAIISPLNDTILCGSDMSSLEDTTKQHYMYNYDPEYVKQMRVPGFDPHLDIAILAKMLTKEQVEDHKLYSKTKGKEGTDYSDIRSNAKTVNFAGIYGAGAPKIAEATGMSLNNAQKLHRTYWQRNKAVKLVEKACKVKIVGKQMWLFNPISKFWYSLRYLKDRFSTLNQGSGVYVFDLWVREVRSRGIEIMLQYHDEIAFPLFKEEQKLVEQTLLKSIEKINDTVQLNVPLGISVDFGLSYNKIH